MKKIAIFSLYLLSAAAVFTSCRKSDNPKLPGGLERFPLPVVAKVAGTDQVISAQDPAAFTGKFTVGKYFPNDVSPQKYDVVVMKNDNKGNVKMLQANITAYPTEVTVTGTQLAALFGAAIVVGDKFDIGVDVTTASGNRYEAFPATGASYASGVLAQPGASTFVRYEAVCQYDPTIFQGNFVVVSDEWGDYAAGTVVPLTMIDATHFSFLYAADNPEPIIAAVNTNTNAVTVTKQVYGSGYGGAGWPYGNISCESVPSVDNFVAPCTGIFSVKLKHTVAAGSFGEYKIVLQRQ